MSTTEIMLFALIQKNEMLLLWFAPQYGKYTAQFDFFRIKMLKKSSKNSLRS